MKQHLFKKRTFKINQLTLQHNKEIIKVLIDKDYIKSGLDPFPYQLSKEEIDYIRDEKF